MKKTILAIAVTLITGMSFAQQRVIPSACPTVTVGGDFNAGTYDTTAKSYTAAQFPLYTALDTAQTAVGAGDSVRAKLVGEYNHVNFETHATIYTGTSCDSVYVQYWGTCTKGNGQGAYRLLQTTTLGTTTSEQVISYLPNSGLGNPYTNYRVTVDVADLAGTCKVQWRSWMLVR